MSKEDNLYEKIKSEIEVARKLSPDILRIPDHVTENLKYNFYEWQREAFEYLLYYETEKIGVKKRPTHLMFNMATGSGKTLLMAATILYYYKKGYKHFLFFVNRNNIVDKTENNFIKPSHSKFLFKERVVIDGKIVQIQKVETFNEHTEDIQIKFTTIQKLYNDIHIEKENQVLLTDLHRLNIVMMADEAHHLNTLTSSDDLQLELDTEITGRTGQAEIERKGWEHTVIKLILHKNGQIIDNTNILLEFTATVPANKQVEDKYLDKTIYKFGLKEFLGVGYTKEINLISSTLSKKERILQALLFSWYRENIALTYYNLGNSSLANFKPVVLFRSKSIDESWNDYEFFLDLVSKVEGNDFEFLGTIEDKINDNGSVYEQGKSRTRDLLEYIKNKKISYSKIAEYIRYNFDEKNCIITNSKSNQTKTEKTNEEQEALLNNLEDKDNHVKAVFTVQRLTEGWDVLNLYDIVRLYQGQNTGGSTKKTPEATISEKQLIGRGVRYYPFDYKEKPKNSRKFDSDINHELRVLEELFYYTHDEESRYISHLKEELRREGYIKDNKIRKSFNLKENFKETPFYKNVMVWGNKRLEKENIKKKKITDIPKNFYGSYKIKGLTLIEGHFGTTAEKDKDFLVVAENGNKTILVKFKEFENHIMDKAINILAKSSQSLYQFENLKNILALESIRDLKDDKFLGNYEITIVVKQGQSFEDVSNKEKFNIIYDFLRDFMKLFKETINPYYGSDFEPEKFSSYFEEPKHKVVIEDDGSKKIENELKNEEWYVLDSFKGTDQEIGLIEELRNTISNLKDRYEEVYLLRNEEVYKIFDFEKGRGLQPDFLLFLKGNGEKKYYQVFIEPKGEHLLEYDSWKNDFLLEITKRYGNGEKDLLSFDSKKYILWGLPMYNLDAKDDFLKEYRKLYS